MTVGSQALWIWSPRSFFLLAMTSLRNGADEQQGEIVNVRCCGEAVAAAIEKREEVAALAA